jgi:hypothetical protein
VPGRNPDLQALHLVVGEVPGRDAVAVIPGGGLLGPDADLVADVQEELDVGHPGLLQAGVVAVTDPAGRRVGPPGDVIGTDERSERVVVVGRQVRELGGQLNPVA